MVGCAVLTRPDDWPEFDLLSAFSEDPAKLRGWAAGSPRRSFSPDGTRLVVARCRRGGPIGVFVTNMAPEEGSAGVESLDLVQVESLDLVQVESLDLVQREVSSRVILPLGVTVSGVLAHDDARVTLALAFDETIQRLLDLGPMLKVTVDWSALARLPEPWPAAQGSKVIDAFAALIASVVPEVPALTAARAEAFVAGERAVAEEEARRHAEQVARSWRNAKRRSARVPLGSLEQILEAAARKVGWTGEAWTALRTFARPALALVEAPTVSTPEIGRSRIGGAPDLRPDTAWPSVDGELLSFVLQLVLDDLPPLGRPRLPRRGLLSLFLGHNDSTRNVEHLVLYVPSSSPKDLVRATPPDDASYRDDETGLLDSVAVQVVPAVRLPPYGTTAFAALAEAWPSADGEQAVFAVDEALRIPGPRDQTFVGGYVEGEASSHALARARARGDRPVHHRWELLLDVASHLSVSLNWWDAGRLAVVVPREDLEARMPRWDRTYAEIATS